MDAECYFSTVFDGVTATYVGGCEFPPFNFVIENCTAAALPQRSEVECTFNGQVENCTACPPGSYCDEVSPPSVALFRVCF